MCMGYIFHKYNSFFVLKADGEFQYLTEVVSGIVALIFLILIITVICCCVTYHKHFKTSHSQWVLKNSIASGWADLVAKLGVQGVATYSWKQPLVHLDPHYDIMHDVADFHYRNSTSGIVKASPLVVTGPIPYEVYPPPMQITGASFSRDTMNESIYSQLHEFCKVSIHSQKYVLHHEFKDSLRITSKI